MPTDLDLANVSADDDLKVGALADGLASTATDKSDVSDSAIGVANTADSNNHNDNSTTDSSDNSSHEANDNGNNRDNSYDYDLKVINASNSESSSSTSTSTSTDDHTKTINLDSGNTDSSVHNKDSGNTDSSTHVKDSGNTFDYADSSTHVKDSGNTFSYADSSSHVSDSGNTDSSTHYDLGNLKDVDNSGGIGIAGGDLNFHLGDDYSFNLNLDNVLNHALNGAGNDTGFTLAQANNLADQDQAYNISMDNSGAHNNLHSTGGDPTGGVGVGYDVSHEHHAGAGDASNSAGHDQSSSIDSSSILANSGYHQEIVQGANLVSNASDISITGGNDHHDTTSSSS